MMFAAFADVDFAVVELLQRSKMLNLSEKTFRSLSVLGVGFLSAFCLSTAVEAASVLKCSQEKKQCVIRVEDGYVGNEVEVLDENAHIAAIGWIVKRQGSYAMIAFKEIKTAVRRGYPVIVKLGSKRGDLQWAASFSDKD